MSTQKKDKSASESTYGIGKVTLNWEGTVLESRSVTWRYASEGESLIAALYLDGVKASADAKIDGNSIVLTLLEGIEPEKEFDQTFIKGETNHQTPWAFIYKDVKYEVKEGRIEGQLSNGHRTIKATVNMTLTNNQTVSGTIDIARNN